MRFTIDTRMLAGIALLGLLGLLGAAGRAYALTPEVRDEAGFFKPQTVTRANEVIKQIKQRYKKDLLVETVRHVPEDKKQEATSSDPKVKARFFADWAVRRARQEGVNGIYVLITREPGHVEVAVGNHTRAVFPDEDRHRLAQILLSHFEKKEYDDGLLEGASTAGKRGGTDAAHKQKATCSLHETWRLCPEVAEKEGGLDGGISAMPGRSVPSLGICQEGMT